MYHHILRYLAELEAELGLTSKTEDVNYIKAVASDRGFRRKYLGALPYLPELQTKFCLTSRKEDPNHVSAGGLRDQYLLALPHLAELRERYDLKVD
jgi:hypothetical protein